GWKHTTTRDPDPERPYESREELLVAFRPDGELVATAGVDGRVEFRATRPGRAAPPVLAHPGRVRQMSFRPGSGQLATAADDGCVRLWDVPTGRPVGEPLAGPRVARRLVFSPDGELFAVAGGVDKTVLHVWNAATGKALFEPVSHDGEHRGAWVWPGAGR